MIKLMLLEEIDINKDNLKKIEALANEYNNISYYYVRYAEYFKNIYLKLKNQDQDRMIVI